MTTPDSSRVLRGLSASVVLAVLIVGIPLGLFLVAGSPVPTSMPSWAAVQSTLTHPDVSGALVLGIVKVAAWAGWLTFLIPAVAEAVAAVRGVASPRLRGLGAQQRVIAALIGSVIAMTTAAPALATDLPLEASSAYVAATAVAGGDLMGAERDVLASAPAVAEPIQSLREADAPPPTYTVRYGDSLWRIAEAVLGDGARFQEIADLNYGAPQPDGQTLDSTHWLQPGWVLALPADAARVSGADAGGAQAVGPGTAEPAAVHTQLQGQPAAATPAASTTMTHVVVPGESLSSIARDLLGDADRYTEIMAASRGLIQPDGSTLVDPDAIRPGWQLVIPAPPDPAAPALASPAPAPATPDSAAPTLAPPGRLAATPDEEVPRGVGSAAAGRTVQSPVPEVLEPGKAPASHAAALAVVADPEVDLRTASGVGGMLAAGIVGLIAMRRVQARRSRRPGERPMLPGRGAPSSFESSVRAVADPLGRGAVDRALRALATQQREAGGALPPVRVVRLVPGRKVELLLDAPSALPAPWHASRDRMLWRLDADDVGDLPCENFEGTAPYPALVTIGQANGSHLLVDLERIGCLDVRGTLGDGRAVLAAMAVELATSPWADDLQVTVVGALAELPGVVDTGRIRHVASLNAVVRELEARALDVEAALRQSGMASIPEARAAGVLIDAWTPEILLVGEQLGPMVRGVLERLVAKVPGVGVAAVVTGSDVSQWAIEVDATDPTSGILHPAGIAIRPQQLDTASYPEALSLLRATESVPGPSWARNLAGLDEPQLIEIPVSVMVGLGSVEPSAVELARFADVADGASDETVPRQADVDARVAAPASTPDPAGLDSATELDDSTVVRLVDATSDPLGIGPLDLGPLEPLDLSGYGTAPDPDVEVAEPDDADVPATVRSLRTPIVRVLGPVGVEVASGIAMPASHQRQATELVAYLAFHPGASGLEISNALWPTREPNLATRRSAVSRARRWLGVGADGHEYLPRYWAQDDGTPAAQESAGYRLRGVRTDWDEFLSLVGPDIAATPTARLVEAMGLVRGPVFAQVPLRKYVWAEPLWQEMTAGIVDVAHEIARRSLLAGDLDTAREAARVGRVVDPADERSWRDSIRAEWADGRAQQVERLVAQLRDYLGSLDFDADPDTEDLITEVEEYLAGRGRHGGRGA